MKKLFALLSITPLIIQTTTPIFNTSSNTSLTTTNKENDDDNYEQENIEEEDNDKDTEEPIAQASKSKSRTTTKLIIKPVQAIKPKSSSTPRRAPSPSRRRISALSKTPHTEEPTITPRSTSTNKSPNTPTNKEPTITASNSSISSEEELKSPTKKEAGGSSWPSSSSSNSSSDNSSSDRRKISKVHEHEHNLDKQQHKINEKLSELPIQVEDYEDKEKIEEPNQEEIEEPNQEKIKEPNQEEIEEPNQEKIKEPNQEEIEELLEEMNQLLKTKKIDEEIEKFEEKIKQLEEKDKQNKQPENEKEIERLKEEIKKLQKENKKIKEARNESKKNLVQIFSNKNEIERLEEEIRELKEHIEELKENKLIYITWDTKEVERLEKEIKSLEENVTKTTEQAKILEQKNQKLEEDIKKLIEKIKQEKPKTQNEKEIITLKEENEKLQEKIRKIKENTKKTTEQVEIFEKEKVTKPILEPESYEEEISFNNEEVMKKIKNYIKEFENNEWSTTISYQNPGETQEKQIFLKQNLITLSRTLEKKFKEFNPELAYEKLTENQVKYKNCERDWNEKVQETNNNKSKLKLIEQKILAIRRNYSKALVEAQISIDNLPKDDIFKKDNDTLSLIITPTLWNKIRNQFYLNDEKIFLEKFKELITPLKRKNIYDIDKKVTNNNIKQIGELILDLFTFYDDKFSHLQKYQAIKITENLNNKTNKNSRLNGNEIERKKIKEINKAYNQLKEEHTKIKNEYEKNLEEVEKYEMLLLDARAEQLKTLLNYKIIKEEDKDTIYNLKYIKQIFITMMNQYKEITKSNEEAKKEINSELEQLKNIFNEIIEVKKEYQDTLELIKNNKKIDYFSEYDNFRKESTLTNYELKLKIRKIDWEEIVSLFWLHPEENIIKDKLEKKIKSFPKTHNHNFSDEEIKSFVTLIWRHFSYYHSKMFNATTNNSIEITSYSNYPDGFWDPYNLEYYNIIWTIENQNPPAIKKISEAVEKKDKMDQLKEKEKELKKKSKIKKAQYEYKKNMYIERREQLAEYLIEYELSFAQDNYNKIKIKTKMKQEELEDLKKQWIKLEKDYLNSKKQLFKK